MIFFMQVSWSLQATWNTSRRQSIVTYTVHSFYGRTDMQSYGIRHCSMCSVSYVQIDVYCLLRCLDHCNIRFSLLDELWHCLLCIRYQAYGKFDSLMVIVSLKSSVMTRVIKWGTVLSYEEQKFFEKTAVTVHNILCDVAYASLHVEDLVCCRTHILKQHTHSPV